MSFKIRTLPAEHCFDVEPGETLLAAALRQGVGLPYGCRDGKCGSCATRLLEGRVDYPSGQTEALEGQPEDTCLTCQAVPVSDLVLGVREVAAVARIEVRTLPCRVSRKERLNHDVMRLFLKLPENQRLQFLAGQYLDFILRDGRRRAFSIANAPHEDAELELHIRHVPGGEFTAHVFDSMPEKSILRIQGPLGTFFLREDSDRPVIMMGGGTGFAPLKGMIEHAIHRRFDRPIALYWGVRARRDLYLADLPETWSKRLPSFRFVPVLSEPDPDWHGRTGFVHTAVLEDHPDPSGYDVYMSGPPIMVEAGRVAFEAAGLARDRMFSDAFEYAAHPKATDGGAT
ncbi:CDP-6-deoxy-delta-3,4-glucoseen reductase [Thiocapsa sp.]|uniref:CDP-6-deoxy-delta-3,4-glucoseen reductase n=1 Tax=Thiocapsa sp. TaxID=2024551 RepID=UPI0035935164